MSAVIAKGNVTGFSSGVTTTGKINSTNVYSYVGIGEQKYGNVMLDNVTESALSFAMKKGHSVEVAMVRIKKTYWAVGSLKNMDTGEEFQGVPFSGGEKVGIYIKNIFFLTVIGLFIGVFIGINMKSFSYFIGSGVISAILGFFLSSSIVAPFNDYEAARLVYSKNSII